ncbi:MAG: polyprenyl synthetase family protein [Kofleriaceae bacterium]
MRVGEARPELAIAELLTEIRELAIAAAPPAWPELGAAIRAMLTEPLPPHSAIPLAMTQAAGGRLVDGVPFAVIWTLISAAVRILDDCADDDVPHALHRNVGFGRALNYASAMLQLSTALLHALPRAAGRDELLESYTAASLQLAAGQDRDLVGEVSDVASYVRIVEDKTCAGYEFACFGGACVVGAPPPVQQACRRAGYHLGMVLQLLDDLESAWLPGGDLAHGRRTFPVWHGLARVEGAAAEELRGLVFGGEAEARAPQLRRLLEDVEAPRSVLAAALEERRLAMQALERCPGPTDLLASYFDFLFANAGSLLRR